MRNYMYHFHTTFVIFIYPAIIFAKSKKSESEPSLIYKHAHCPQWRLSVCAPLNRKMMFCRNGTVFREEKPHNYWTMPTQYFPFSPCSFFLFLKTFPLLILTKPRRQYEDVKNYIICCHGGASKSTYLMKTTIKV